MFWYSRYIFQILKVVLCIAFVSIALSRYTFDKNARFALTIFLAIATSLNAQKNEKYFF